mgnify:CR=1 FL=1
MALELLPDGTFKKLTKVQTDALNRYYKRENKKDVATESIALFFGGLPLIIGVGIASTAYIFRDTIKEKIEEEGITAGLGLAKLITQFTRGEQNRTEPMQPEVTIQGNVLSRCQRYEADYVNQNTIAEGIPFVGVPLQALAQLSTIQSMKIEGCSKPSIIPQSQWDQG